MNDQSRTTGSIFLPDLDAPCRLLAIIYFPQLHDMSTVLTSEKYRTVYNKATVINSKQKFNKQPPLPWPSANCQKKSARKNFGPLLDGEALRAQTFSQLNVKAIIGPEVTA
jgi:hypothetical protein